MEHLLQAQPGTRLKGLMASQSEGMSQTGRLCPPHPETWSPDLPPPSVTALGVGPRGRDYQEAESGGSPPHRWVLRNLASPLCPGGPAGKQPPAARGRLSLECHMPVLGSQAPERPVVYKPSPGAVLFVTAAPVGKDGLRAQASTDVALLWLEKERPSGGWGRRACGVRRGRAPARPSGPLGGTD